MIFTVTLNPSLDYNIEVEDLKLGELNLVQNYTILPGGKGINVAAILHNLEHPVMALGLVSGFTGRYLIEQLTSAGILSDFVVCASGATRINVKLKAREETEINGLGGMVSPDEIQELYDKLKRIQDGDYLVLSGSVPASIDPVIYSEILHHMQQKKIRIVVDARRDLMLTCLPYHPFLVKPNLLELQEIFNVTIDSNAEISKYGRKLIEMGAQNVLVSLASKGAYFISGTAGEYFLEAPKGVLKNSVGAGDAMVAGFISGYIETTDYKSAFRKAVSTGSANAFSLTTATREQIEQLYEKVGQL